MRIGLVSDTHGLLRPAVLDFLRGSDRIVHAGDICDAGVLEALAAIAPLTAVRGNNDVGPWSQRLHETELLDVGGVRLLVIHDLSQLGSAARDAKAHVVVSGHSHKPLVRRDGDVLFVNPGSAGPRRFKLPISAGELLVGNGEAEPRLVEFQG
ncbi:metallophosphoesterase family protein [Ramlibacter sp. MMS24-I3-19]|uniref:metallophosphoesterase family protein n=1 Tax=Ramlibacter sp. MMS24-I3-19 TaxID=3416606 RepID=UPI003D044B13